MRHLFAAVVVVWGLAATKATGDDLGILLDGVAEIVGAQGDVRVPVAPAGKAVATVDAPAEPTNLRVEALTDTSARVHWDAVKGATDYDVNYRTAVGGRWTNEPHEGTRLYNTIYDLEPNTEYRWAVRAENKDGTSDWVFGEHFTTLADARLGGDDLADARLGGDDLNVLLDGVAEIGAPGVPGPLCVYGPSAFPVIVGAARTGARGARAPVVAAARWSAGRVVALGHGGYFERTTLQTADTGRMMTNALRWAAGGLSDPRIGVVDKAELRAWLTEAGHDAVEAALTPGSLQGVDVVALDMWNQRTSELEALSAFVRAGGGLVTASTGWVWADLHPDLDLINDYAGNRLLAPVGIQWAYDRLDRTSSRGYAVAGPPYELVHAGTALDAIQGGHTLRESELDQARHSVIGAARSLPPDDLLLAPRLRTLVEGNDRWPSAERPVNKTDVVSRLAATLFVIEHGRMSPRSVRAHPAAADFPGSVPADAPRVTRRLTIDTTEPRGHSTGLYARPDVPRWHSTSLYAAPGERVTVTVPAAVARKGDFHVRVGVHSDDISVRDNWTRMPQISRRFPISAVETLVANAFGGLIYVEVPVNANLGKITVKIEGAVAAPLFVLGETDLAAWRNEIRHAPAPWAEIAGRNMIVTTPASEVRDLDDPAAVAETWDRVLDLNAELAAWPSNARLRPERFVVDRQISGGWMHAGYPMMGHLYHQAKLVDSRHLRSPVGWEEIDSNWGMFHEVGHNHQSDDWTFEGTVEVTVNLFTLYVFEFLCGIPVSEHERGSASWRAEEMARYDFDNPDFELWKREPFLALVMYVQLQQAFGWDAYRQVFATYRALPDNERPTDDDDKRDQWMVRFSRQVGHNLGPFFEAWGVPTSQAARNAIADLPVWMPPEMAAGEASSKASAQAIVASHIYPNPFNATTTIHYDLTQATRVRLDIYNGVGQRVRTLVDAHQAPGHYAVEWDTTDQYGQPGATGIYFMRLKAEPNPVQWKKMMLVK